MLQYQQNQVRNFEPYLNDSENNGVNICVCSKTEKLQKFPTSLTGFKISAVQMGTLKE